MTMYVGYQESSPKWWATSQTNPWNRIQPGDGGGENSGLEHTCKQNNPHIRRENTGRYYVLNFISNGHTKLAAHAANRLWEGESFWTEAYAMQLALKHVTDILGRLLHLFNQGLYLIAPRILPDLLLMCLLV